AASWAKAKANGTSANQWLASELESTFRAALPLLEQRTEALLTTLTPESEVCVGPAHEVVSAFGFAFYGDELAAACADLQDGGVRTGCFRGDAMSVRLSGAAEHLAWLQVLAREPAVVSRLKTLQDRVASAQKLRGVGPRRDSFTGCVEQEAAGARRVLDGAMNEAAARRAMCHWWDSACNEVNASVVRIPPRKR
ncbi:MAG: hypothetical protein ACYC8T_26320, partial [Myxococcaceae bacterium]